MKKIFTTFFTLIMSLVILQVTSVEAAAADSSQAVTTSTSTKPQGKPTDVKKEIIITKRNVNLWAEFTFKKTKTTSNSLLGQPLYAAISYHHKNGQVYYSLYDSKNKWVGYINRNATTIIGKKLINQNISINNRNQKLWTNFSYGKVKNTTAKYYDSNINLVAKVMYSSVNGNSYYSLYDSKGKWQGYLNTKFASSLVATKYSKTVQVKSSAPLWNSLFWVKKGTAKTNTKYTAKYVYKTGNKKSYLSLYSGSKWMGYINKNATKDVAVTSNTEKVVKKALSEVGKPYVYGAAGPNAFDCSGLTQYSFKGIHNISRTTTQQEHNGKQVSINSLKRGDLVFWGSHGSTYHVALYLGNHKYVHAPKPGDKVKVATMSAAFKPSFGVRVQ